MLAHVPTLPASDHDNPRLSLSGNLGDLSARIPSTRPQQVLELAGQLVKAPKGGIGFLSGDGQRIDQLACLGASEELVGEMWRSPWLGCLLRFILQQEGPICLPELTRDQPELGGAHRFGILGPILAVPLTALGRASGAFFLARHPGEPLFTDRDLEIVLPLCRWLQEVSVFEEASLLAQLRLLNRVAQAAASNLDLAPLLQVALRELDRHLPMNVCSVWLADDSPPASVCEASSEARDTELFLTLAATSAPSEDRAESLGLVPETRLLLEQTPFAGCWKDGNAIYTDWVVPTRAEPWRGETRSNGESGLKERSPLHEPSDPLSCFATPLRAGDQTVGILQSICTRPSGFTAEQIQMLYLVADLLGPAISNCKLYGRLRLTYEELQATQDKLIHAEKMRAIGELASGMAHDFNNSLCGVLGFLELALADKVLSPGSRAHLEAARTCAFDAAQTVRRVQDFARWRRTNGVFQPLDVNELVRQTIELTRHKWESLTHARETPITVEVRSEAQARVLGNAAELREVLTNLVFNAVDAMPRGGTLTFATWSNRSEVYLSVGDTGVGMNSSVRQRLFEPFFTTKGERGNGMGLSVAFGIIQRHGGEILVASEVDQGSTFTLRLPPALEISPDPQGTVARAEAQPPSSDVAGVVGLNILVVEDEETISRFLNLALTQLGHRPRSTRSADEALKVFAQHPFDVVLTDLGLPGVSGEEVARKVAQLSPATPVVLLTGWAEQLKAEGKPLEGVWRILGKPVTIARLSETLAALAENKVAS
jgi:signal transduction histidine kinase